MSEEFSVCPKCGKKYNGYPATSRVDNKTAICPECGIREALDAFGMSKDEQEITLVKISEEISEVCI